MSCNSIKNNQTLKKWNTDTTKVKLRRTHDIPTASLCSFIPGSNQSLIYCPSGQLIKCIKQLLYAECSWGKEKRTQVYFTQKGSDLQNIPTAGHWLLMARRRKEP